MPCIYGYPQCSGCGRAREAWHLIGQMMDPAEFIEADMAAAAKDPRGREDRDGKVRVHRIVVGTPVGPVIHTRDPENRPCVYTHVLLWCSGACHRANVGNHLDVVVDW